MEPLIIYHANCPDGLCAAWLFSKAYPNAEFFEARYNENPPNIEGRDIFIVDFSYPPTEMEEIIKSAKTVKVLDHHKSAIESLEALRQQYPDNFTFELNKSGAGLAWEYLWDNPTESFKIFKDSTKTPLKSKVIPPFVVAYIQDRDLWRWELTCSKEINATISSYPLKFESLDTLLMRGSSVCYQEGAALLRMQDRIIEQHIKQAKDVKIQGYTVPCVNATVLISEIGAELARNKPFAVLYYDNLHGRTWSLRSDKETGGIDVSEIAAKFKGGGHANAAGCRTKTGVDIFDKDL